MLKQRKLTVGLSWGNRALSNTWNTIVLVVEVLTDAMPVDGSTIVGHLVGNMNNNIITPISKDRGTRNSAVESKNVFFESLCTVSHDLK